MKSLLLREDIPAQVVSAYSRRQALEDGVLMDVSPAASELGFVWPVAVTADVWHLLTDIPAEYRHEDLRGRLWDCLFMGSMAIRRSPEPAGSELYYHFVLHTGNSHTATRCRAYTNRKTRSFDPDMVLFRMEVGSDDDGGPCLTIMLPDED